MSTLFLLAIDQQFVKQWDNEPLRFGKKLLKVKEGKTKEFQKLRVVELAD